MRALIACEYSGTVRDAFSRLGWDAWSCDLLPTESELTRREGKHIQGDVIPVLSQGWDLMVGHPPCNYISYAGTGAWNRPGRSFERLQALQFFATLWEAPIPYIALENPKSCASPVIAKYSQEIQPYYFGDPHVKTTWLWLKNLPKLNPTNLLPKPEALHVHLRKDSGKIKKRYYSDAVLRDPKERARFWPGIAQAMAEQWTDFYISETLL